jgi:type II secretory pathway component GspD/PulD (secretin)
MRDLLLGSGLAAGDQHAHVYQLRHARAEDVAKAITDFLNAGSAGGGAGDTAAGASNGTPAGQRVVPEKTTNSLLVRGTSEELATIERLVSELDRAPREVLVQALLVEVELGNVNELGVELGFQDSVLFDRSVVDKLVTVTQTTTAPNGTQTTNQNIISQTAAPGFNFMGQPPGNNVAANPGRVAPQGLSSFGMGRVNGDLGFGGLVLSAGSESVNVLLRALDASFNIEILSRPQVRSVENHEALIQIGQQVPVVDGVSLTPVGSANPQIRQDKAGIILRVTPRISPDARVQLDVEAEKSSFNLTPGSGVPIFTDATNGNVIEAPIKDLTTAQTTVSVQSGHTIVLGGMISNDQTTATRKLPWLGDIPIIGRLFRYDYNRLKRKELLVFLTPTVLEHSEQVESIQQREMDRIHLPAEAWNMHEPLASPQGTGELVPEGSPELQESYPDVTSPASLLEENGESGNIHGVSRSGADQRQSFGHSILKAGKTSADEQPPKAIRTASGTFLKSQTAAPEPQSSWRPSSNYRGPASLPPEPPAAPEPPAKKSWNPLRFQRKASEQKAEADAKQSADVVAAQAAARKRLAR